MNFEHEQVVVQAGTRSGQTLIVAVHSTALGPAGGGCRLWEYKHWDDGLQDALLLSEAMTLKCAAAELPLGGGKAVIPLEPRTVLDADQRQAIFLDFGDLVESFGGRYKTAEDVGTTADDMWIARQRTQHALCLPPANGGSGEPSAPTAVGVFSAIQTVLQRVLGSDDIDGRRFTMIGLGQVGMRLATRLAEHGARLTVTDTDDGKRDAAHLLGATWVEPADAPLVDTDVLVPAALGGLLTPEIVPLLQCKAIVGPANNQLADPAVAGLLAERGILWAPDFVVNAGGAIHGALVDIGGRSLTLALEQAAMIGPRLSHIFDVAATSGETPYVAAVHLARERVAAARRHKG